MLDWFALNAKSGLLDVRHEAETWRSNQAIADFSDTAFPARFKFAPTISKQAEDTGHDGVFAITEADAEAYVGEFDPQPLRDRATTASGVDLPFQNFGKVKGLTFDRVLIYPTTTITKFLTIGAELAPKTACGLTVAVTSSQILGHVRRAQAVRNCANALEQNLLTLISGFPVPLRSHDAWWAELQFQRHRN